MDDLTASDRRVLDALVSLRALLGYSPTVREIATEVSLSVNVTHRHLVRLRDAGAVTWTAHKARTIRALDAVVVTA